jgi:hypothetical protein
MESFHSNLLDWYDGNARKLPWRIEPAESKSGVLPDPYHIWLSEVMLQQTTVAAVKDYFSKFITLWPTVNDLARASQDDVMKAWAGLGYYSRARNLKKCADYVAHELNGQFLKHKTACSNCLAWAHIRQRLFQRLRFRTKRLLWMEILNGWSRATQQMQPRCRTQRKIAQNLSTWKCPRPDRAILPKL